MRDSTIEDLRSKVESLADTETHPDDDRGRWWGWLRSVPCLSALAVKGHSRER
jgi:hypothetical protein